MQMISARCGVRSFVTTQQRSVSGILCYFVTSLLKWQSVHTLVKWQVTEVIFCQDYARRFHQCNQTMAVIRKRSRTLLLRVMKLKSKVKYFSCDTVTWNMMRNVFHETLLNHTLYNGWSGYNCLITHDNIVSHKSPSVKPRVTQSVLVRYKHLIILALFVCMCWN